MGVSSRLARIFPAAPATVRVGHRGRASRTSPARPRRRTVGRSFAQTALLLLCAVLPWVLCADAAHAAKHPRKLKPIVEVVAAGEVTRDGAPATGAIVYLENPTNLAIKSYLTGPDGKFHFNNIAPQTDYDVWAELNGVQSKHKFISQFSNHTKFIYTLKLVPKGKHKLLGIF